MEKKGKLNDTQIEAKQNAEKTIELI